jgi:hypothetical protein
MDTSHQQHQQSQQQQPSPTVYANEFHRHIAERTDQAPAVVSYLTNNYYAYKHIATILAMIPDSRPLIPKGLDPIQRSFYIHAYKTTAPMEVVELQEQPPYGDDDEEEEEQEKTDADNTQTS